MEYATQGEREDGIQENEAGQSLPETPGTPSQQAAAVGANTWASRLTYMDILMKDTEEESTGELARCTGDQDDWRRRQ